MTTEERRNVRAGLLAAGFRRAEFTDNPLSYDRGDGVYQENWWHREDGSHILLTWDKKTK